MFVMAIILRSIVLVGGSALTAGLLCWLAMISADLLHHHGWAAILIVLLLSILFLSGMVHSEFVRLSALCGLCGALFLWISASEPDISAGRNGK